MPTIYDLMAVVMFACPHCHAPEGEQCHNTRGRRSWGCHWQRRDAVQQWRKADHQELYKRFRDECLRRLDVMRTPEHGTGGCA